MVKSVFKFRQSFTAGCLIGTEHTSEGGGGEGEEDEKDKRCVNISWIINITPEASFDDGKNNRTSGPGVCSTGMHCDRTARRCAPQPLQPATRRCPPAASRT